MGKIFKRGLLALAPVAISIVIIVWLLRTLEDIFSVPLKAAIGPYYFPGMGLLVAIVFIFFVGVIINNYLIQKCTNAINRLFTRIPLFKTIYNSIGDMMAYFQPKDEKKRGKMVIVEVDSLQFLAILTREDFSDLPQGMADGDRVNIFIPFSYQIGGFTATVPRSKIRPIDMSIEEGMRFVVSAGMISGKNQAKSVPPKLSD